MDQRLFFVLGDLGASIAGGALIGWLIWLLTPLGWNMLLVMVAAMLLGMVFAIPLSLLFGSLFGAMEVMVPLMLTGMVAGMVVGMHATMTPIGGALALLEGAVCGLACIVAVWVMNNHIRGPQALPLRGSLKHD
ncbi:hypothetical protein [Parahaliea aestuarii]|uniref:Uncharacterized protein n=1 Tax=Parahaliea aestuarii TaxID=1852021 RepID=A0A5C8ZRQ5_9GAMM|nr:hypothetical protein [Parahaliea aestuarii]TXS90041.1 hypothetical protein FVW59_15680 [Parahaliea aestuarii]